MIAVRRPFRQNTCRCVIVRADASVRTGLVQNVLGNAKLRMHALLHASVLHPTHEGPGFPAVGSASIARR